MSNANPYSITDAKLAPSHSESTLSRLPIRHLGLHVPAFVLGCIIGTEIAWNWLIFETLWHASLLWFQPLSILAQHFAVWLIASLAIAVLTFMVFPPRSILAVLIRGTVGGLVFAIPMHGIGWLATYLAPRGIALPGLFFPESWLVRYTCYAAFSACFDLLACLLLNCGRRRIG